MRKRKSSLTSAYLMRFPRAEMEALRYIARRSEVATELRRLVLFGLKHSAGFDWGDFVGWLEESVYPKETNSVRDALEKGVEDLRELMAGDFVRPPDSEEKPILSAETVRSFLKTKEPVEVLKKDLPPILDDDAVASFMSDSTEKKE